VKQQHQHWLVQSASLRGERVHWRPLVNEVKLQQKFALSKYCDKVVSVTLSAGFSN